MAGCLVANDLDEGERATRLMRFSVMSWLVASIQIG